MRTTLTLDDDVAIELRRRCAERGRKLKVVVNESLRAGLAVLAEQERPVERRYVTSPVHLGRPRLPNLDDIAEVLSIAEGEDHS